MKKESLQITTVKTLLAVLLFAGIGTIIISGGWLIGKQGKVTMNIKEPKQKAIDLVKSQKLFSDLKVYESIRSSNLFKKELRDKILVEIKKDSNLNLAYQNNKEESDKLIETITNLKTVPSFSAETLDDGNIEVGVFLNPDSTETGEYQKDNNKVQAYYIVDTVQNEIVEQNVNMGIPSFDLTKEEVMNQIYRDYTPVIFEFLQMKQLETIKSEILYFYFPGCPHCKDAEDFLNVLELKYKRITVKKINIKESSKNMELANSYAQSLMKKEKIVGVPFIVVEDKYILGWKEDRREELENYVITADWQTYRNEEFGFEIEHKHFSGKVCSPCVDIDNNMIVFTLYEDGKDIPYSDFRISALKNDEKFSAEELVESIKESVGNEPWFSGVSMTEQKTKVNGYDAYVFDKVFGGDCGDRVYFIVHKNQALRISFTESTPNYDNMSYNLEIFNKMLSSFRFIEKEDASDWQTYRNEEFGFEVKYPEEWKQCEGEDVCFRKEISFDHPRRFTEINIKANQNNQNLSLDKIIFDFENANRIYKNKKYIMINDRKAFKAEIANWGMVSGRQFLIVGDDYWYDIIISGIDTEKIEIDQIFSTFKFIE